MNSLSRIEQHIYIEFTYKKWAMKSNLMETLKKINRLFYFSISFFIIFNLQDSFVGNRYK